MAVQSLEAAGVSTYALQVGGHIEADGLPAALKDSQGRFLKKLQAGERGDREVAFYAAMEQQRAAGGNSGDSPLQQLARWVPRSFGVVHVGGCPYLMLEDVAGRYQQPGVMDVKVGFRTWYPWASDELQAKYRAKDAATSQASLGFRLCGLHVPQPGGAAWHTDRHWGKQLTRDGVTQALQRFGDNGCLCLRELVAGPGMLLEQLATLAAVFEAQASWHCFSASLLVVYEGGASRAADARPLVRLIDFAHAFPTLAPAAAGQQGGGGSDSSDGSGGSGGSARGPCGVDANFLAGLRSFMAVLAEAAESESSSN